MKFAVQQACNCGGQYLFLTYGDAEFGSATCSNCGNSAHLMDPLSVSVTAERLLYRSGAELGSGDYSLSIVIAVMAIESFLTRLFLKLKGMDSYASTFSFPTLAQEEQWEKEYPRSGGFSGPVGFVSQRLAGTTFDKFVAENAATKTIFSRLPNLSQKAPTQYFQNELFSRRNRIAHWGYVNSNQSEAELCHMIATSLVSILREMDRTKYGNL
ncbi:MAG TPA: hypothetical protein VGK24_00675 [Candidatus Angelobacter sp.]|jgi:hypothetical protein